jgi:hypothetical protein
MNNPLLLQNCKNLLTHYENVVLTLHTCHTKYAMKYNKITNILSILNIIFGTIAGTSAISIYNNNDSIFRLLNIILVYIMTIIAGFQKIIDPSKYYERFRNASQDYLTLYYEINYKKIFELQTEEELKTYVQTLNSMLEDMRVKFPFIDDHIYEQYKEQTLSKQKNKEQIILVGKSEI